RLVEQKSLGAYNAVGPNYELSVGAMLHGIHAATGGDARFAFATADFLEAQKVRAGSDFPIWVPGQGETVGFHRMSNAKSTKAGLTYRPLATTAADTLAWFNTLPEERRAKLKAGLTAEREAAVLQAWHAQAAKTG